MKLDPVLRFACVLALCVAPAGRAAERKIGRADLPAAVQKAVDDLSKGATIKGYSKEDEGGQSTFEVEMTIDGHSRDVSMTADGQVLEVEEQVELTSLPANVQQALKAKAHGGAIAKVESITRKGKLVAYEAQVKSPGRHREIQVGPDGSALAHEE